MNEFSYSKNITVEARHIDELNHVNNSVYVQWIQEISGEHWYKSFKHIDKEYAVWVVLEHHIKYLSQSFLGDELKVITNIEKPIGLRFPRIVKFYKNDKLIVEARTLWTWIDSKTHRPIRIPESIMVSLGKNLPDENIE